MPVYGAAGTPASSAGNGVTVWNAETPAPPSNSASVGLRRNGQTPMYLSAEVRFAAAPGAFSIELQVADTDADEYYVTKATLSAVTASHVGRIELSAFVARFARLRLVSRTNSVAVTAKIF